MQGIVDLIGRRPRLDLKASYFVEGYKAEIEALRSHQSLIREIINSQM